MAWSIKKLSVPASTSRPGGNVLNQRVIIPPIKQHLQAQCQNSQASPNMYAKTDRVLKRGSQGFAPETELTLTQGQ